METMVLKEPKITPTKKVLEQALGKSYPSYEELINTITNENFGMTTEWRYYNDGKAWLCKAQYKKKTVCWISVWDNYFKTSFYFTEKNSGGIDKLDIDEGVKNNFKSAKHFGNLIPLVFHITQKKQLKEVLKVIEYKKGLR
jgi:hypothetical protein